MQDMPSPTFPLFARLPDKARAAYQGLYGRLSVPYCDFSLNNALVWLDRGGDLELSRHGDCVVLRFASPFESGRRRYALFGTGDVDGAMRDVLAFMQVQGEDVGLCMVPEETVASIHCWRGLHIQEERGNADYVFHVETAHGLKGQTYGKLRGRISAFENGHSGIGRADLDLRDRQTNRWVRQSIEDWMSGPCSRQNDLRGAEAAATARHLALAGSIPVHALGTFVGDRLVSVSLYHHPPHPGWVILNRIVRDYRYKGAFGYSFHQVIRKAYEEGRTWLNAEQDLGKPGLRRTKSLLRPRLFLKRHSVSLSTEGP
jgi:hypothetical protein